MGRIKKKKSLCLSHTVAVLARKLGYSKMKAVSDVKIYKRSDVRHASHVQVRHLTTTFDDEKVYNSLWPFFPKKTISINNMKMILVINNAANSGNDP